MIDHEQPLVEAGRTVDSHCPRSSLARSHGCGARMARGFTLLELLVVVTLLATVAALVVANLESVEDGAQDTVTRATLQTIREAIVGSAAARGYIADMKHVPGFNSVEMRLHDLLSPEPALDSEADRVPDPYKDFDPVTSRGWRGPYLQRTPGVQNTLASRNGRFPEASDRRFIGDKTFQQRGFSFVDELNSEYGRAGDLAIGDTWGNPVILQIPDWVGADDDERFRYARLVSAGPDGELDTGLDRLAGWANEESGPARDDDVVLFLNRADVYEDF